MFLEERKSRIWFRCIVQKPAEHQQRKAEFVRELNINPTFGGESLRIDAALSIIKQFNCYMFVHFVCVS